MRHAILIGLALLACHPAVTAQRLDSSAKPRSAPVDQLIQQLGSNAYVERRIAQRKLQELGLAAFDGLLAAQESSDPEIAVTAERLLSQMAVHWPQPGDSAFIRDRLERYGEQNQRQRAEVVGELSRLPNYQGAAALCRIARFDLSPRIAARAAVAVMTVLPVTADPLHTDLPLYPPEDFRQQLSEILTELAVLYGPSSRRPAEWIAWFAEAAADSPSQTARWQAEVHRLQEQQREGKDIEQLALSALEWNLLRAALLARDNETAVDTTTRLLQQQPSPQLAVLKNALDWMVATESTAALHQLLDSPQENPLLQSQPALYVAAGAWHKHGHAPQAEQLAQQAYELGPPEDAVLGRAGGQAVLEGRAVVGWRLRSQGYPEWAERELRGAIEQAGLVSANGSFASWELADMLQDRQAYQQAAEVLDALTQAIDSSDATRSKYRRLVEGQEIGFRAAHELQASSLHFRALAAQQQQATQQQLKLLRKAIELDPSNADIVIAMYRAGEPDFPLREEARQHVRRLAAEFESHIDEDPQLARFYNQWAWLVSNTEGDFQKAVRYSLRSLQRSPGNAGFLDTLGRCYYAAGDLPKAIEAQTKAVQLEPQYQVMHRQLAFFQAELAQQQP